MNEKAEDIYQKIKDMGYVVATPRGMPKPSFYKLPHDNTILSIMTNVSHLIPHPQDPNGVSVNSSISLHIFVPKEHRKPPSSFRPNVNLKIIDEDVEYVSLKENFNVYDLSNGMILSVKTIISQIGKTDAYNQEGEPIYKISSQPVTKLKKK